MNMRERGHENESREAILQAEAEAAERQQLPPGANPQVDEYRLVLRALRQPPAARLPADFAARMAARVLNAEERGSLEDWLVTVLMLGMAIAGVVYVQPVLAAAVGRLHVNLPALPWPLLVAAAVAVGVAWAFDRGATRWHHA